MIINNANQINNYINCETNTSFAEHLNNILCTMNRESFLEVELNEQGPE